MNERGGDRRGQEPRGCGGGKAGPGAPSSVSPATPGRPGGTGGGQREGARGQAPSPPSQLPPRPGPAAGPPSRQQRPASLCSPSELRSAAAVLFHFGAVLPRGHRREGPCPSRTARTRTRGEVPAVTT